MMQGVFVSLNVLTKAAFKKTLFYYQIGHKFEENLVTFHTWNMTLYGAGTWAVRRVDQE